MGIAADTKVYRIDDRIGAATAAPDLEARRNRPTREAFHVLVDDFAGR